jgi:hypothetical protein
LPPANNPFPARLILPVMDGLIMATAQCHGLTAVTRNVQDFGLLPQVFNPWRVEGGKPSPSITVLFQNFCIYEQVPKERNSAINLGAI